MNNFLFISTADFLGSREFELGRMIASLSQFRERHSNKKVSLYLLMQRCESIDLPDWINVITTKERLSLSKARNLLIDEAFSSEKLGCDSVFAFPDDDAWYPDGTLELIDDVFNTNTNVDMFFCKYSNNPSSSAPVFVSSPSVQKTISNASSNTIFFRGSMASKLGYFDERLGVGAELGGGEDTEYSIRAYYQSKDILYCDSELVGHRDPDEKYKRIYYKGALYAIAKNYNSGVGVKFSFIRKILVGAYWSLLGKMNYRDYFSCVLGVKKWL